MKNAMHKSFGEKERVLNEPPNGPVRPHELMAGPSIGRVFAQLSYDPIIATRVCNGGAS